jgi:HSP20 family protein
MKGVKVLMSSDESKQVPKKVEQSPFDGLMNIMNNFFYESPMKDFFENLDDLLKKPIPLGKIPIHTYETNEDFIIEAELAGVNRDQIQLDFNNSYLTITVNDKQIIIKETNENDQLYQKSQSYQHLKRTIPIPFQVVKQDIKAAFKDGLLRIRIPIQKSKQIDIE